MQHTLHLYTHLNHLILNETEPKGGKSALLHIMAWSGVKMVIGTKNDVEWS